MTQINLNGLNLPEVSRDRYSCWEEDLSVQVEMISGRVVIESRGKVWKASYQYDYMGNTLLRLLLAQLRTGAPVMATVLTDSGETVTGRFVVESVTQPTFAFSRGGEGLWHNVGFTLREERPHG